MTEAPAEDDRVVAAESDDDAPPLQSKFDELFGGWRGLFDSSFPTLVFVAVNAWRGLRTALWAAVGAGAVVLVERLARKRPVRHAVSGFFGVLIAVLIARLTGRAEGFFLPGIALNAIYGVGCLVSVVIRRPAIGLLLQNLFERPPGWLDEPGVRRACAEATIGWSLLFFSRVAVQSALVAAGRPGWLAVAKIGMGWPLFIAAIAATWPWIRYRTRPT
jgi:hypothetical protein